MTVAVDTNVMLDVLLADPTFLEASQHLLVTYMHENLVISEVVYSELSTVFPEHAQLDDFLRDVHIRMTTTTKRGLWMAGQSWRTYSERRRLGLQCGSCGDQQQYSCYACSQTLTTRQRVMADFMIAGHALEHGGRLLTRDRGFYCTYFPELEVIKS